MSRLVVISGCSGGGKSSLLAELARQGHAVVEEPGRRIVRQETALGGDALPWVNPTSFAHRAMTLATADHSAAAASPGWTFFDRSAIDAASALQHLTGSPVLAEIGRLVRYHRTVFLAQPWPELFASDDERRHDMAEAEYHRLEHDYQALGYDVMFLPRAPIAERAAFVLDTVGTPT